MKTKRWRIRSNFRDQILHTQLWLLLCQIGLHKNTPRWQAQVNLEENDRYLKSETRNVFKCSCRKVKWDNWQFQWDELKPNRSIFRLRYSFWAWKTGRSRMSFWYLKRWYRHYLDGIHSSRQWIAIFISLIFLIRNNLQFLSSWLFIRTNRPHILCISCN